MSVRISLHHSFWRFAMPETPPFAYLAILAHAAVVDAMEPTIFSVYECVPEKDNSFGLRVFALPETSTIEFPITFTTWLKHLPPTLTFHGQKNPQDETCAEYSFDETVVVVAESTRSGALSKIILPNGIEYPIIFGAQDCTMAAFVHKHHAEQWLATKIKEFKNRFSQLIC